MALGNNLKRKKLIPELNQDEEGKNLSKKSVKKSVIKAPAKKKETKKSSPIKAKKDSTKEVVSDESQTIAQPQNKKPEAPLQQSDVSEQLTIEDTQPTIVPTSELVSDIHSDKILSSYSLYVAKEVDARKKILRKKYINEIIGLQGKQMQFILITIGGSKYALDMPVVKEVVPVPSISKTPNTPDYIKGIANVRGNNYVVFELKDRFNIKDGASPSYLLILSDRKLKSSLLLATLPVTFKTNGSKISHSLRTIEDSLMEVSYVKGIIQNEDELIYYLDINELLRSEKAVVIPENLTENK